MCVSPILTCSLQPVHKEEQAEKRGLNQCYFCDQEFLTANMLRRHCRQSHGKERCHVCLICNKAFNRATHIKIHTHTHTHTRTHTHTHTPTHTNTQSHKSLC